MLIVAQDLIDDPHETVQFRTPDRLRPAIPGRQAVAQHLAHRLSGQSEASRRRTLAQPFHIDAAPYLSIELHLIHPSCVPRNTIGMLGGPLERSGFPPPSGDADRRSVVYFCSAVLIGSDITGMLLLGVWVIGHLRAEDDDITDNQRWGRAGIARLGIVGQVHHRSSRPVGRSERRWRPGRARGPRKCVYRPPLPSTQHHDSPCPEAWRRRERTRPGPRASDRCPGRTPRQVQSRSRRRAHHRP